MMRTQPIPEPLKAWLRENLTHSQHRKVLFAGSQSMGVDATLELLIGAYELGLQSKSNGSSPIGSAEPMNKFRPLFQCGWNDKAAKRFVSAQDEMKLIGR